MKCYVSIWIFFPDYMFCRNDAELENEFKYIFASIFKSAFFEKLDGRI